MQYCLYGEVEKGQDQIVKMGVRPKVDQMSNLGLGPYYKGVPLNRVKSEKSELWAVGHSLSSIIIDGFFNILFIFDTVLIVQTSVKLSQR